MKHYLCFLLETGCRKMVHERCELLQLHIKAGVYLLEADSFDSPFSNCTNMFTEHVLFSGVTNNSD